MGLTYKIFSGVIIFCGIMAVVMTADRINHENDAHPEAFRQSQVLGYR
jgi:hypothetical protein